MSVYHSRIKSSTQNDIHGKRCDMHATAEVETRLALTEGYSN